MESMESMESMEEMKAKENIGIDVLYSIYHFSHIKKKKCVLMFLFRGIGIISKRFKLLIQECFAIH